MKTIAWWALWVIKIGGVGLLVLAANDRPASAMRFSEYICERYCKKLDPLLDRLDERIRDWNARRRGEISFMVPPPVPGRGPSCGLLPQQKGPACCADAQARLFIEYSGGRDPYVNKARYRLVCRK